MVEKRFNLVYAIEFRRRSLEVDSRDAYGFSLRPQHQQSYREYTDIYKEEEEERSERWKRFLNHLEKSTPTCSSEENHKASFQSEVTGLEAENISERGVEGDDPSSGNSASDDSTGGDLEKEVQHTEKTKTNKVQAWVQIRLSLSPIENMMSPRVRKRKNINDEIKVSGDHVPIIKDTEPPGQASNEDIEEDVCVNDSSEDRVSISKTEQDVEGMVSSGPFSPWEELESLVRGGVPKDLRGLASICRCKNTPCGEILPEFAGCTNQWRG